MENLTTAEGVIKLMSSSRNDNEWNQNCDRVKKANGGYPSFWYATIIASGLCDRTLGAGKSDISIATF